MHIVKCFKYRLMPTPTQEQFFRQVAGCRRVVWNYALARKKETYATTGRSLSYNELAAEIVALKRSPETAFLKQCPSQALQQVLMDLESAFKNFFEKRAQYPKFKTKRKTPHTFRLPQSVVVVDGKVSLPKIGLINAKIHRPFEGVVKSATVKQEAMGNWFVTFVSHIERPQITARTPNNSVGIDVGLTSFVTFDTGGKVAAPRLYRQSQRKLKRLQRELSRCAKGSRNGNRARIAVARQHARVRNQRNDFLHKLSTKIVSQFDTICIEDLNLKGLVKTKLAKSFNDAALGSFVRMLEYKAEWSARRVIRVGRWFPSTKICSTCGHTQTLTLSDRPWVCAGCTTRHDRDVNAARNILREGLRLIAVGSTEMQNASGADVRPALAGSL